MKARLQDVDLKLLRVFQAVARHQGFSAARDVLNTTQSAISMSMAQLESRLDVRLCTRGVKGFHLTEHGKEVLASAEKLFAAIDEFRSETESLKGRIAGRLRIGVVDNICFSPEFSLPASIQTLTQTYPDLEIDIFVGAPQELEERLLDGRIRAAVGLFHRKLPKLAYRTLFQEVHELYCGAAHPYFKVNDDALSDDHLLAANYVGRDYLENFQQLKPPLEFRPVASSSYIEGLAILILSGNYIAYLPIHYAANWVAKDRMRSIRRKDFARRANISLVYRRASSLAPELSALLAALPQKRERP